jgi:GntR family transcriptional regulator/MocR family aminotransferase
MLTYAMNQRDDKSKYYYLYSAIKEDILSGTLNKNEKLPSKRSLAEHLGVSLITVETAYQMLKDEGYIESRERSGYFVVFCSDDGFVPVQQNSFDIFSGTSYNPENDDEFPFSVLAKTMRKVIGMMGEGILVQSIISIRI